MQHLSAQVAIAAERMIDAGLLPKEPFLQKEQELRWTWRRESGYLHRILRIKAPAYKQPLKRELKRDPIADFKNVTVKYRAVKGEPPKIFDDFSCRSEKERRSH